jgi:hypothetical protein
VLEAGKHFTLADIENDEWAMFNKISWLNKRISAGEWPHTKLYPNLPATRSAQSGQRRTRRRTRGHSSPFLGTDHVIRPVDPHQVDEVAFEPHRRLEFTGRIQEPDVTGDGHQYVAGDGPDTRL